VSLALQPGFLHGKKTGFDNFMAICEFGNESGGNKTGLYCILIKINCLIFYNYCLIVLN
jgi:hypothetical protein